jgi:hypothetical protein
MHSLEGEYAHCQKVERQAGSTKIRAITAAGAVGRDRAALMREQLADNVGKIQEIETDIVDRSPIYKRYWAKWNAPVVTDGLLDRHWESADGRTKAAQAVVPESKLKKVLAELLGGPSGDHLGINKTLAKIRQRYNWLHSRNDLERWCQQCDNCAANRGPRTRSRDLIHQYDVRVPFERNPKKHRRTVSGERERKSVPPDCHGLLHQVAGGIFHP